MEKKKLHVESNTHDIIIGPQKKWIILVGVVVQHKWCQTQTVNNKHYIKSHNSFWYTNKYFTQFMWSKKMIKKDYERIWCSRCDCFFFNRIFWIWTLNNRTILGRKSFSNEISRSVTWASMQIPNIERKIFWK